MRALAETRLCGEEKRGELVFFSVDDDECRLLSRFFPWLLPPAPLSLAPNRHPRPIYRLWTRTISWTGASQRAQRPEIREGESKQREKSDPPPLPPPPKLFLCPLRLCFLVRNLLSFPSARRKAAHARAGSIRVDGLGGCCTSAWKDDSQDESRHQLRSLFSPFAPNRSSRAPSPSLSLSPSSSCHPPAGRRSSKSSS